MFILHIEGAYERYNLNEYTNNVMGIWFLYLIQKEQMFLVFNKGGV